MVRIAQTNLGAGILSEGMYAREDTQKFRQGLKDAVNVFVRTQGGVSNRAGLELVTGIDTSGAAHEQFLVPFSFNDEQTYQVEFTDNKFRVIRDGGYVIDTSVTAAAISDITSAATAEITLSDVADAADFPSGTLAYVEDPNGTHALHKTMVKITGASGAQLSFTVFDGSSLDTATGSWGAIGAGATLSKVYEQSHSYTLNDLPKLRFAQDADTLYMVHPSYPVRKLTRSAHDNWTLQDVSFGESVGTPASFSGSITGATQANPVVLTIVAHGIAAGDAFYVKSVGGMTEINNEVFVATSVTTDTITLETPNGTPVDGTAYTAYTSGGTATTTEGKYVYGPDVDTADLEDYVYAVAAVDDENSEEGLPSGDVAVSNDLFFSGSVNTIGWRAVAGAARYNIYKKDAGAFGYIGTTTATTFADENITPDVSRGPRVARDPFNQAGDYPSIVSFYEQRLAFGATDNDPQLVEMSRVGNPENFGASYPQQPDDAFKFRVRAQKVNKIRAFVPHESFMLLTSSGEWEIAPQGDGEYVRPDKRRLSPVSYYGTAEVPPILVGEVALYVEPSHSSIRDIRLRDRGQPPGDLTVLSRDLFEDREVVSWAYAAAPDRIVWCVLDNGELLSMTYVPEHDVWSWTRHEIAGEDAKVKQVSVVREGTRDVPYFVVSRTLGAQTVTLVERLAKREQVDVAKAYYVDSGFHASYSTPVSEITGLLHLRDRSVTVLADGDELVGLVVDDTGTVSLGDRTASEVSVGLPYSAWVQTLDVNFQIEGVGSSEGVFKAVSEVALKLEKSRGVEAGQSLDKMNELKEWDATLIGGPIPLKTHTPVVSVDGDWVRDATMYVRQTHALPFTLNAITPEWEVGG